MIKYGQKSLLNAEEILEQWLKFWVKKRVFIIYN